MEMAGLEPAAFCLQCIQHQAACYAAKTQVGGEPLGVAARPTWVTRSTHHQFRSLLDRLDLAVTVVTAGALHSPCQHACRLPDYRRACRDAFSDRYARATHRSSCE